jgi:hypothetical protein
MRKSGSTPSIVPSDDQNVYLVVDDLGRLGRVWRETDVEKTDLERSFAEGWSKDVLHDVARQQGRLTAILAMDEVPKKNPPA